MLVNPAPYLDQSTKRAFGISCGRVQKNTIANLRQSINPLTDRAGRVSTFQRNGGNQQMREGMQKNVRQTGKLTTAVFLLLEPRSEAGLQPLAMRLHFWIEEP